MVREPLRHLYDDNEILTSIQSATIAGRDRRTIIAWIHRGLLKAHRDPGARGRYRILWCDLYDAIHQVAHRSVDEQEGTSGAEHDEAVVGAQ